MFFLIVQLLVLGFVVAANYLNLPIYNYVTNENIVVCMGAIALLGIFETNTKNQRDKDSSTRIFFIHFISLIALGIIWYRNWL